MTIQIEEIGYPNPSLVLETTLDFHSMDKMGKNQPVKKGFVYVFVGKNIHSNKISFLIETSTLKPNVFLYRNTRVNDFFKKVSNYKIYVIYPKYKMFPPESLNIIDIHLNSIFNSRVKNNKTIENSNYASNSLEKPLIISNKFYIKQEIEDIITCIWRIISSEIENNELKTKIEIPKNQKDLDAAQYMSFLLKVNETKVKSILNDMECTKSNDLVKEPASLVSGVIGSWGVGKTTYVNKMIESSNLDTIIVFDPWGKNISETEITSFLINEIIKTLVKDSENGMLNRNITDPIINFLAIMLDSVIVMQGGFPVAVPVYNSLTKMDKEFNKKELPFNDAFNLAYISALKLEKPILVVIDNLDRLLPAELSLVVKLIRGSLSIPNVIFLLAYDEIIVHRSLTKKNFSGTKYFKKIVDEKKYILSPSPYEVKEEINKVFVTEAQQKDLTNITDKFFPYIENFRNFRDTIQLIKEVKKIYDSTNLYLEDLFLIEEIKASNIELWYYLYNFRDQIHNTEINKKLEKQLKKKLKNEASENEYKIIKNLIPTAFSSMDTVLKQKSVSKNTQIFQNLGFQRNRNTLGSKEGLNSYFENRLTEDFKNIELSKEVFQALVNDGKKLSFILNEISDSKNISIISLVLSYLISTDTVLPKNKKLDFFKTTFEVLHEEKQKSTNIQNDLNNIDGKIAHFLSMNIEHEYKKNKKVSILKELYDISERVEYKLSIQIFLWLLTDTNKNYENWRYTSSYKINQEEKSLNKKISRNIVSIFPSSYKNEIFDILLSHFWLSFSYEIPEGSSGFIKSLKLEEKQSFSRYMKNTMVDFYEVSLSYNSSASLKDVINKYLIDNIGITSADKQKILKMKKVKKYK